MAMIVSIILFSIFFHIYFLIHQSSEKQLQSEVLIRRLTKESDKQSNVINKLQDEVSVLKKKLTAMEDDGR